MTTTTAAPPTTVPPLQEPKGLWRDAHHRYFYGDQGPFPSVTQIAGVLDKSGPLVGWAKRETAACAVRNLDLLSTMIKDGGKDAAQSWLSSIPDYQRDTSAELGTRIHALADAHTRGEDVKPSGIEVPFLRGWYKFIRQVQPHIVLSECMVMNLALGYGGTFDLGVIIDDVPTLLDIKTGNDVYRETAIQLAGYDLAEFWATPEDGTPQALPKWERYGVVHIRPDEYSLIPFSITDTTRDAFRAAYDLYRWQRDEAPWAKQAPIQFQP